MRFILLTLLTLVNSYFLPKPRTLVILKNNKCCNQEYRSTQIMYLEQEYFKKKISELVNIRKKFIELTKELVDEEYSTEWDFYNKTWEK